MVKLGVINYSSSNSPGGINKFVHELSSAVAKLGVDVTVLEPDSDSEGGDRCEYRIVKLPRPISKPPINRSKSFTNGIVRWIEQNDPDVIHVNGHMHMLSHQVIKSVKNRTEVPIVFSPHYDIAVSSKISLLLLPIFNRLIGKNTISRCDAIVFDSEFEKDAFSSAMNSFHADSPVIPLGVDFEITSSKSLWDKELRLVYCGHLVKRKRVDRLIGLSEEISRQSPETLLNVEIIGDGPEKEKLRKIAEESEIGEKISWSGFLERENMLRNLRDSDFFVLLSDSEAFGITVAESLALGTGAVISDNTALSEFSSEPGCIMAVDPDNFSSIAEVILETEGVRRKIGPFTDKIRNWQKTGLDYYNLYRKISE